MSEQESNVCETCGGYTNQYAITRRLPAMNSDGVPYPLAPVPPIKLCPGHPEPVSKHEQPIGFVVLDKLLEGDELEQVKREVQAMMDAYDGVLPFPEYAERYMRVHPSQWDYHALAQYVMPPNDPRSRSVPKHDGRLDEHNNTHVLLDHEDNQVHVEDVWTDGISLTPAQALSLLAWLKQEEAELQRLAKEQEA